MLGLWYTACWKLHNINLNILIAVPMEPSNGLLIMRYWVKKGYGQLYCVEPLLYETHSKSYMVFQFTLYYILAWNVKSMPLSF